eukprot:972699-Prymnesium_polylepis.1
MRAAPDCIVLFWHGWGIALATVLPTGDRSVGPARPSREQRVSVCPDDGWMRCGSSRVDYWDVYVGARFGTCFALRPHETRVLVKGTNSMVYRYQTQR